MMMMMMMIIIIIIIIIITTIIGKETSPYVIVYILLYSIRLINILSTLLSNIVTVTVFNNAVSTAEVA